MPYIADDEQRGRGARHFGGLGSPIFWAEIVRRQLARIEDLQSAYASILEAATRDGTPIPVIGGYDARLYYPDRRDARGARPGVLLPPGGSGRAGSQLPRTSDQFENYREVEYVHRKGLYDLAPENHRVN